MSALRLNMLEQDRLKSPVEERHLNYILEEEFTVNPHFLDFFLAEARQTAPDASRIPPPVPAGHCSAVRSATTHAGESDVLVRYKTAEADLPVAIMIEDKVHASFQPRQAERYRERGEEGKGTAWSSYWTCLVAHERYPAKAGQFDAVVSLQALLGYFIRNTDIRSQFRANLFAQTIAKYEATGVQNVDPGMTRIRALYAEQCTRLLDPAYWSYDQAREAWWGDTWFEFRAANWPRGVKAVHQAQFGRLNLILPTPHQHLLQTMVDRYSARRPQELVPAISVVSVGRTKAKSALQAMTVKFTDFTQSAVLPNLTTTFDSLQTLAQIYEEGSDLLPIPLRPGSLA